MREVRFASVGKFLSVFYMIASTCRPIFRFSFELAFTSHSSLIH